jgi:hypothetical protein
MTCGGRMGRKRLGLGIYALPRLTVRCMAGGSKLAALLRHGERPASADAAQAPAVSPEQILRILCLVADVQHVHTILTDHEQDLVRVE